MTIVDNDTRIRTVRALAEVDDLKDFWARCHTHRDADFDFYLFYLRNSPEVVRPHVIVLYRDGRPHAMLVGRLEKRGVYIRFGYIRLVRLRLRALTFMYRGVLGDISSAADAKDVISCIEGSLRAGEADAAFLEYLRVDSPLYSWARTLPNPARVNHFAESSVHHIRNLPLRNLPRGASFLQSLSSNQRRNQKRRVRRLAESFDDRVRIECFQDASAVRVFQCACRAKQRTAHESTVVNSSFVVPRKRSRDFPEHKTPRELIENREQADRGNRDAKDTYKSNRLASFSEKHSCRHIGNTKFQRRAATKHERPVEPFDFNWPNEHPESSDEYQYVRPNKPAIPADRQSRKEEQDWRRNKQKE